MRKKRLTAKQHDDLCLYFRKFLMRRSPCRQIREELLGELESHGWSVCLFGGTLRDIAVSGPSASPRDFDIVVSGRSRQDLKSALSVFDLTENRFGGFRVNSELTSFDVWRLEDTWAFVDFPLRGCRFQDLPKTTFLSTEAIVVDLLQDANNSRNVYEHGFFESIANRTIDINLPENPFPASCIAKTLVTARRLQFDLSSRLATHLIHAFAKITVDQVHDAQLTHYGVSYLRPDDINEVKDRLSDWHRRRTSGDFSISAYRQNLFPFMVDDPVVEAILEFSGISEVEKV